MCWKKASPACARAHNIKRVKDLSLDQCKELCAKTEGCVAFEYGVNHGGARKHYRPRDCQLNTWTNTKGCDGFYNNLDFYTMTNCDTSTYMDYLSSELVDFWSLNHSLVIWCVVCQLVVWLPLWEWGGEYQLSTQGIATLPCSLPWIKTKNGSELMVSFY